MSQGLDYLMADEKGFTGELLDMFLAHGYYRMQHAIFTCNEAQIDFDSYSIPVFWLRTIISKIRTQKMGSTIRKKCSSFAFAFSICKPSIFILIFIFELTTSLIISSPICFVFPYGDIAG